MGTYTPPSSDRSHYLSLQEAAALGYGAYSTLCRWTRNGKLPAVKIGGRVKVLRADLDTLVTPKRPALFVSIEDAVQRLLAAARQRDQEQDRRDREDARRRRIAVEQQRSREAARRVVSARVRLGYALDAGED